MTKHGWNTLAVVSPGHEDGTTFVAANLAVAVAAEHNLTSLLVDLDLRSPRLHERFGVDGTVGVEDCLAGRAQVADALVAPEDYPGLVLLPARVPVRGSSELLGGQRARALFRELKERYVNRVVIYDLPPVLASDDALVFAPQADAVLVVVGDHRTRREDLVRCLDLLQHVPLLGTVLNGSA
jgi:Mrp family chromosome partitioning ATPase